MQRNKAIYSHRGMNQDISKSKRSPEFYYEANNIRITTTSNDTLGSVTIDKGNNIVFSLGTGTKYIIGATSIDKYIVLFATDNLGGDEIWKINEENSYEKEVIFSGNLNFSTNNYIEAIPSYENKTLQKVYWVDGVNPLRVINILKPPVEDYPELLDAVPFYNISQPRLESIGYGGLHTSGQIQYAYNLAIKNGQQTRVSPASELIPLVKQDGGGEVNEIVGQINNIVINNVDTKFDIIKVYAIKYTSYNQAPVVSLIAEEYINGITFRHKDDGKIIYNISMEELLFLGGNPFIPKTIESKKNRLILGNITENYFDINVGLTPEDEGYYDTRAFRFPKNTTETYIKEKNVSDKNDLKYLSGTDSVVFKDDEATPIPKEHDCITELDVKGLGEVIVTETSTIKPATTPYFQEYLKSNGSGVYYFEDLPDTLPEDAPRFVNIQMGFNNSSYSSISKMVLTDVEAHHSNFKSFIINQLNSLTGEDISITLDSSNNIRIVYFYPEGTEPAPEILTPSTSIKIYEQVEVTETTESMVSSEDGYFYLPNSSTFGAKGNNIKIEIVKKSLNNKYKVLKTNEIYRFGIEFFNAYGQVSQPHWICDLRTPSDGNFKSNDCLTLKVTLNNLNKLKTQGVVGYRVKRVERTDADKTIITQGIPNACIFQETFLHKLEDLQNEAGVPNTVKGKEFADDGHVKMPTPFIRGINQLNGEKGDDFNDPKPVARNAKDGGYVYSDWSSIVALSHGNPKLCQPVLDTGTGYDMDEGPNDWPFPEILRLASTKPELHNHNTYQETRLGLLYSPEILFLNPQFGNNLKIRATKKIVNKLEDCSTWAKQISTSNFTYGGDTKKIWTKEPETKYSVSVGDVIFDLKIRGKFNLFTSSENRDSAGKSDIHSQGMIGPAGGLTQRINKLHYYRKFNFESYANSNYESLKGNPRNVGAGEAGIVYNGEGEKYTFNNHLFELITDYNPFAQANPRNFRTIVTDLFASEIEDTNAPIISVNSIGNRCVPFLVGEDDKTLEEFIAPVAGVATAANNLRTELALVEIYRELSNQYGGDTYEARSNNSYIDIGNYSSLKGLNTATTQIDKPGDTYVTNFKFQRIANNLAQVENMKYTNFIEIVEVPIESSINNDYRHDLSVYGWDNNFQPSLADYHKYNRVYSQEPIATATSANPFTFEAIRHFNNKILATKVKTAGELIDSWTDVLINEELTLDGKYGELIKIISLPTVDLAFQEKAIAALQIQPRIQQVTNDGLGVELGTGQVLYDYTYFTTDSGCTNPRGVFKSPSAAYYVDSLNKSINRITGEGLQGLTSFHGLKSFMDGRFSDSYHKSINIHGAYDPINSDVYFIFKDDFALKFNEQTNSFTDFFPIEEANIMFKSKYSLYSSNNSKDIYKHFIGDVGSYYGSIKDSYITYIMNPNPHADCIFDNLQFKSELYSGDTDVYSTDGINFIVPIKSIQAWNEYQNTGEVDLVHGVNIARTFRDWNLWIPQPAGEMLSRMRGNWIKIKFKIDNTNNYRLVLHDIILTYTDNTTQL